MAASIYATPPPDLSSEDTALSDVSNSSINHNNNNNNNNNRNRRNSSNTQSPDSSEATTAAKKSKRFIADVLMDVPSQQQHQLSLQQQQQQQQQYQEQATSADMGSSTNTAKGTTASGDADTTTQSANAAIAAVAAAANAAMQLQLLEAINDAAKKRRKQNNPIRLGGLNLTGDAATVAAENVGAIESALEVGTAAETGSGTEEVTSTELQLEGTSENEGTIDYEEKLSKMFLPKSMEQLKETFEMLQQQQQKQLNDISTATLASTKNESNVAAAVAEHSVAISNDLQPNDAQAKNAQTPQLETDGMENPYQTYCKECGENFETEFKLSLHMLAEHAADDAASQHDAPSNREQLTPYDILASVKVKMEHPDYDSQSPQQAASSINEAQPMLPNGKEQQQWLSQMPGGMSFPHFPPEAAAAAALSAGGYLPLLGGLPGFPGVDGLNRPPLRIFNPEAYCDLCNKEFCNKYFLKTHKANKHGIYDPANSGSTESSGSNSMSQMFQLQMQQQHQLAQQQQQLQQQKSLDQQQQMQAAAEAQAKQQQQHFLQQQITQQSTQAQLNITQQQQQQQPQITPPAPPPIFCEICSKRFTNVFAMRRHRAKTHEQRTSPNEQPSKSETAAAATQKPESPKTTDTATKNFQMPEGFRQDFTLEQEEVSFTPQPRKLSPQSQQQARDANFSHDKLKRLGVLNPEAFCELCCKEYCNKYFLRTHKWKRHGIFVPPEEVKEELLAPKMQSTAWPFMNMPAMPSGMPLNLMMANQESRVLAARGMLAAAAATKQLDVDVTQQMAKRIKLESTEEDESHAHDSLENQENKSENQRAEESRRQQPPTTSSSTSPEPQKMLQDSITNAFNLPAGSPDAAVGLQNLQKLQSMIQQLNDLNGKRPVGCHLCGKEMENQYSLHAHIMTEHAAPPGMPTDTKAAAFSFQQHLLQQQHALKLSPTSSPHGSMLPNPADLRCIQCDREFATTQEFKQHIAEVHLLPGSPLRDGFVTPERPINAQTGTGARAPYTMTPTSSYCEICNKELCNKYFMKTHMQRMHGIEIENGAQIGGVVCNICNKELCSKYFLRVHKHNTHGIIEEGSPLPQPRQNGLGFEVQQQQQQQQQQQHQHQQQQQQLMESELARGMTLSPFGSSDAPKPDVSDARYMQQHYNEACPLCNRRFRSPKWLRAHLMSDHGAAGAEKLRELDLQYGNISKPSSPTLKIPNGTAAGTNPVNLAQALQSLNSQHLLGSMPKAAFPGMFGTVAEQALQSPRFKEYQCSMCAFTTPYYAFLFIHERSHSILNTTASGSGSPSAEQQQQQTASNDESSAPTTIPTKPDAIKIEQTGIAPKSEQETKNLPREANVDSISFEATDLSKRSVSTPATPTEAPTTASNGFNESQARSAATSPFVTTPGSFNILPTQDIIKQIAQNCGKPACYAVPHQQQQQQTTEGAIAQEMQAFIMEEHHTAQVNDAGNDGAGGDGERSANRFVPAIIYLPVRERISGPLTVSFTLTPA